MNARIIKIFVAENTAEKMTSVTSASLVAGKGIKGDRYYSGRGTFSELLKDNPSRELTLIEKEQIERFNETHEQQHEYGDFRRNIVTEGIGLNDLVGKEFSIGAIILKGVKLCEPCKHLADTVNSLFLPNMIGVCGLRAQILSSGDIDVGDKFVSCN